MVKLISGILFFLTTIALLTIDPYRMTASQTAGVLSLNMLFLGLLLRKQPYAATEISKDNEGKNDAA